MTSLALGGERASKKAPISDNDGNRGLETDAASDEAAAFPQSGAETVGAESGARYFDCVAGGEDGLAAGRSADAAGPSAETVGAESGALYFIHVAGGEDRLAAGRSADAAGPSAAGR